MIFPLVSVILATYNGYQYLEEVLLSIRNQTYPHLEILIIDDASSDIRVKQIIDGMIMQDNRIRYLRNATNMERSWSKNFWAQQANGDFIAFVDDDDVWEKEKIDKQVQILQENDSVGIVGTYAIFMDEKDNIVGKTTHLKTWTDDIHDSILLSNPFIHSSVLIRKDIFLRAGWFPEFNLCEDYDLWFRVLQITKGVNIPDFLVKYRMRSSGTTARNFYKMKWKTIQLVSRYRKKFPYFFRAICIRIMTFPLNTSLLLNIWNTFK